MMEPFLSGMSRHRCARDQELEFLDMDQNQTAVASGSFCGITILLLEPSGSFTRDSTGERY